MLALAKPFLCSAYKLTGLSYLAEAWWRGTGRGRMAVLLFHRVTDEVPEDGLTVSTARFRGICDMLRHGFRVVPLAEAFRIARSEEPIPHRTVAITFDDCYRDNLAAARVLAEYGYAATFFLPTAYVDTDQRFPWDAHLKPLANLSWDDVREMSRLGFEIGSHSATHPDLGKITREEVRRELLESRTILESQLQKPVRWFAYPFGGERNFRPEWRVLVRETGYDGCVSGYGGFLRRDTDVAMLPRESVTSFSSTQELELYLSGALYWYYALKRKFRNRPIPEAVVPPSGVVMIPTGANPNPAPRPAAAAMPQETV